MGFCFLLSPVQKFNLDSLFEVIYLVLLIHQQDAGYESDLSDEGQVPEALKEMIGAETLDPETAGVDVPQKPEEEKPDKVMPSDDAPAPAGHAMNENPEPRKVCGEVQKTQKLRHKLKVAVFDLYYLFLRCV